MIIRGKKCRPDRLSVCQRLWKLSTHDHDDDAKLVFLSFSFHCNQVYISIALTEKLLSLLFIPSWYHFWMDIEKWWIEVWKSLHPKSKKSMIRARKSIGFHVEIVSLFLKDSHETLEMGLFLVFLHEKQYDNIDRFFPWFFTWNLKKERKKLGFERETTKTDKGMSLTRRSVKRDRNVWEMKRKKQTRKQYCIHGIFVRYVYQCYSYHHQKYEHVWARKHRKKE